MKATSELGLDLEDLAVSGLERGLKGGDFFSAFTILRASPSLCIEPRIAALLSSALLHDDLSVRYEAAKCLAGAGEPTGVDHLVFNALAVHPITGATPSHKFFVFLMPYVHLLQERHLELLIADLKRNENELNCITLSAVESEYTVRRLSRMLESDLKVQRRAAYILGWHRDPRAKAVLIEWLKEPFQELDLNPIVPAVLSDVDGWTVNALRELGDPTSPRYQSAPRGSNRDFDRKVLLPAAQLITRLGDATSLVDRLRVFREAFGASVDTLTIFSESGGVSRETEHQLSSRYRTLRLFGRPSFSTFNQCPEFLAAFATQEERAVLADENARFVDALFDQEAIGYWELLDGRYLGISYKLGHTGYEPEARGAINFADGVRVLYARSDYMRYATEWIEVPEKYRRQ